MTSLDDVREAVAGYCDLIRANFKPGAKITVLVRRPEHFDGSQDFVLTDDDLSKAISALIVRRAALQQGPDNDQ